MLFFGESICILKGEFLFQLLTFLDFERIFPPFMGVVVNCNLSSSKEQMVEEEGLNIPAISERSLLCL